MSAEVIGEVINEVKSRESIKQIYATGRRKTATARVFLRPGTGKITINKRDIKDYFPVETLRVFLTQPLKLVNLEKQFDIYVTVSGGGISGQAGAIRHGIARALVEYDPSLRKVLKSSGCLTRDPRMKERKKSGQPRARKQFQFSKR